MTTRRALLVAGAAVGLAACAGAPAREAPGGGSGTGTGTEPGTEPGTGPGTGPEPSTEPLARLEDLTVGVPVTVTAAGVPLLLVRTGESSVVGFSAVCPHQGCTVTAAGEAFACPCHGSEFAADGAVTRGPATENLTEVALEVSDGAVTTA